MQVGVAKSSHVFLSKPYLRGVLKELLNGESFKFHTTICDKDFLKERLFETIRETCFELAKIFWIQAKRALEIGITRTPFVYYDEDKKLFKLSQSPNSEELLLSLLESNAQEIIIYSTFYQRFFDKQEEFDNDYIYYCTASKMELFLRKKINI